MINRIRPIATQVTVDDHSFTVRLNDSGRLRVPWQWVPNLLAATPEQRGAVRNSASGVGLHWDQLGKDISVSGLMREAERRHLGKAEISAACGRS